MAARRPGSAACDHELAAMAEQSFMAIAMAASCFMVARLDLAGLSYAVRPFDLTAGMRIVALLAWAGALNQTPSEQSALEQSKLVDVVG